MIQVRGNILESDYVSAQYLHSRARRVFLAMGVVLLVLGLVITVSNFLLWMDGSKSATDAAWFPLLVVVVLGYIFVFRPWCFRWNYRKTPAMHEPISIDLGDGGMAYSSENGQGEIPWRLFIKWREGKKLFLIYSAPNLFHVVPKHLLPSDDVDKLRALLSEKLGRAA